MNYGAQIWGQHDNEHIKRVTKLQDRAIRYINFANYREPPSKLYRHSEIIKFKDNVKINNYLYAHNSLNRRLPTCLNNQFHYLENTTGKNTRSAEVLNSKECLLELPKSRTNIYGIHSITDQSARIWNYMQITQSSFNLHKQSRNVCKQKLEDIYLKTY